MQVLVVRLPGGHGVLRHAGGKENGLPELFDGAALGQLGEELFGPGCAGDRRDAPLILVVHGVAIGLDDGEALAAGLHHLLLIDALEAVGVLGGQVDPAGQNIHVVLEPCLFPFLHPGHDGHAAVPHVELLQGLVAELHGDLPGAGLVALVHQQLHEFGLIQAAVDQDLLALLDVDADAGNKAGILAQNGLLHG